MLLESFPKQLTVPTLAAMHGKLRAAWGVQVVLPFFPTGTMERVIEPNVCATANTLSKMFRLSTTATHCTCTPLCHSVHTHTRKRHALVQ